MFFLNQCIPKRKNMFLKMCFDGHFRSVEILEWSHFVISTSLSSTISDPFYIRSSRSLSPISYGSILWVHFYVRCRKDLGLYRLSCYYVCRLVPDDKTKTVTEVTRDVNHTGSLCV